MGDDGCTPIIIGSLTCRTLGSCPPARTRQPFLVPRGAPSPESTYSQDRLAEIRGPPTPMPVILLLVVKYPSIAAAWHKYRVSARTAPCPACRLPRLIVRCCTRAVPCRAAAWGPPAFPLSPSAGLACTFLNHRYEHHPLIFHTAIPKQPLLTILYGVEP
jgi:hypothetical protein